MKLTLYLVSLASAGFLAGCAATLPPPELINARAAYQQASVGQAAQLVPAELHKAQDALAIAEKSFKDDPKSFHTRDLAYIADRKAKMAEALATTAAGNAVTAKANQEFQTAQTTIVKNTKDSLATEQKARIDAETKTADVQADLAKLAAVKEEERGLVITLSGSVLFASNKSTLLPSAQDRLTHVADALLATKERRLTIEGFTDSRGSTTRNLELSQERADAVRTYLVSRGYSGNLILAHGIGKERPVADNASAEGRANNRRVEIIVDHAAK